jgi:dihydropteroate synthase
MIKGHHAVLIEKPQDAIGIMQQIGVDPGALPYMVPKAIHRCLLLKDIKAQAALILKQEMLSRGGEASIRRSALACQGETDVLLMGTLRQFELLTDKIARQPFGLAKLAVEIKQILENLQSEPQAIELANGGSLSLENRPVIMGILNVTPDSFSDGGQYLQADAAMARALEMTEQGADIIDVGAVSSRPDAELASETEEIGRIVPVVERLCQQGIIVSVDTFRPRVAEICLQTGVHLINDIGRLQLEPGLLEVLVKHKSPVVLMHNRMQMRCGEPYNDIVADIIAELQESIDQATSGGLDRSKIIIDPGIGFGKDVAQNRLLIKRLWEFKSMGLPILLGASRKRFIGQTLDTEVHDRLEGSLAVAALGIMNGANIIRVHDVLATKRLAQMMDAIRNEQ